MCFYLRMSLPVLDNFLYKTMVLSLLQHMELRDAGIVPNKMNLSLNFISSWHAGLYKSKAELHLPESVDMHEFIDRSIRGSLSHNI